MSQDPREALLILGDNLQSRRTDIINDKRTIMSNLHHALKRVESGKELLPRHTEALKKAVNDSKWRVGKNGYITEKGKLELFKKSFDFYNK